ncbi:MAG: hypothetical protein HOV84_17515 [Streptomyces sp.]|nr:hypothetical protein [Streptomyces sp.]
MDDQQLLVGIVGGLIGWLIGMVALRLVWYLFSPRGAYYVSPRRLRVIQQSMQGLTRAAMGKDPGEPR